MRSAGKPLLPLVSTFGSVERDRVRWLPNGRSTGIDSLKHTLDVIEPEAVAGYTITCDQGVRGMVGQSVGAPPERVWIAATALLQAKPLALRHPPQPVLVDLVCAGRHGVELVRREYATSHARKCTTSDAGRPPRYRALAGSTDAAPSAGGVLTWAGTAVCLRQHDGRPR